MKKRTAPERVWYEKQSCEFESWWKLGDETIRINIKRDSYDMQSSARAYIWSPVERRWNVVTVLPYPVMASLAVRAYEQADGNADHSAFYDDEAELIEMVEMVLGHGA